MMQVDYKNLLIRFLPPGMMWPGVESNNGLTALLDAFAAELARIDARAAELINEAYPDTTIELLDDWERVAGLPDDCTGALELLQQRRDALLTALTGTRSHSRQYFTNLAASLGYAITITESTPFRASINHAGDPLSGATELHTWQVNTSATNAIYFRASQSAAGDPLFTSDSNLLECVFNALKPAHTIVQYNYV